MSKVIFLEDEEVLGKIYKKNLEKAGYKVMWTKNVEDTEYLVNTVDANFVILDHGIKGYEKVGVDIIPLIKNKIPKARVIMLSNYSQPELQEKAIHLGANAFLIKLNTPPNTLVHILNKMQKLE